MKPSFEGAIAVVVGTIIIVTMILMVKGSYKKAVLEKADQTTYLQECLERTTDKDWCYRRIFNLNLEDND